VIETTNDTYAIELANCPEPHVCGFLRDAVDTGLLARLPETCTMHRPICLGACTLDCDGIEAAQPIAPECYDLIEPLQCSDYLACKPVTAVGGGMMRKPDCP
jgi:hypothetical protein